MRSVHDSGLFFGSAKDEVRRTYRNQIQNNAFLSRRSKWTVSTSDTLTAAVAR